MRAAYGALVRLHAHYLAALDAQAHVSAGQHHRVLSHCEADHALSLRLIRYVGGGVVDTVDVIQVKDRVVVLFTF